MAVIIYKTCKCHHCGYEWSTPVERPVKCPSCQSRKWDTPKPEVAP